MKQHHNFFAFVVLSFILTYKPTPTSNGQNTPFKVPQSKHDTAKSDDLVLKGDSLQLKSDSADSVKNVLFNQIAHNQDLMLKKKQAKPKVIIKEKPVLVPVPILVHPPYTGYVEQEADSSGKDYLPIDKKIIVPEKKKEGWVKRLFKKRK